MKRGTNQYAVWTPEDEQTAQAMKRDGKSLAIIARKLKKTVAGVRMKLKRLAATRPAKWKSRREETLEDLDRLVAARLAEAPDWFWRHYSEQDRRLAAERGSNTEVRYRA